MMSAFAVPHPLLCLQRNAQQRWFQSDARSREVRWPQNLIDVWNQECRALATGQTSHARKGVHWKKRMLSWSQRCIWFPSFSQPQNSISVGLTQLHLSCIFFLYSALTILELPQSSLDSRNVSKCITGNAQAWSMSPSQSNRQAPKSRLINNHNQRKLKAAKESYKIPQQSEQSEKELWNQTQWNLYL